MPNITVNPVNQISVRVGPGSPAAVQSVATFTGPDQTANTIRLEKELASNVAYLQSEIDNNANVSSEYTHSSFIQANAAFALANSISNSGVDVWARDNSNTAISDANTAGNYANSAFATANSLIVSATDVFARNQANAAFEQANTGYTQANLAFTRANTGYTQANIAFTQANTASNNSTSASSYANAAFARGNTAFNLANTKLNKNGDTMLGDLLMTGNIIPTAANTYFLGTKAKPFKSLFVGPGSVDIDGIVLSNTDNALIITSNTGDAVDIVGSTNGAFLQANAAYDSQNTTGVYANSAYLHANAAYVSQNTTGVYANSAYIHANSAYVSQNTTGQYANSAYLHANASYVSQNTTGVYANASYGVANSASSYANSAYAAANTGVGAVSAGSYANGAFVKANTASSNAASASSYANSAYAAANSASGAAAAGSYANSAYLQANASYGTANSASSYANGAFAAANVTNSSVTSASSYANSAYIKANSSYDAANVASIYANSAYGLANTTIAHGIYANGAFNVANLAGSYANSAYIRANNSLNVQTGGTVTGDVTVTGNLFINGTTTTINTTVVQTTDSLIKLANNNIYSDTLDIGFYGASLPSWASAPSYHGLVRQAGSNNFLLFRDITQDPSSNILPPGSASVSNVGTLIANVAGYTITSYGTDLLKFANAAFIQANAAFDSANAGSGVVSAGSYANSAYGAANSASSYANSAFIKANNALALTGGTISGNVTIQQDLTVQGNVTFTGNATSYQITGNTGQFFGYTANGFNALYAGIPTGYLVQPQTVQQLTSNFDGYSSINMQNINTGPNASFDMFITADNGTPIEGYLDVGLGSSTYNYGDPFTLIKPNDGYFFVHGNTVTGGGNTIIGSIHNDIVFATGGAGSLNVEDEVLRINTDRNIVFKGNLISTSSANVALGNVSNVHIYGGNTGQLLTTDGTGNISFIDLPTPNTVTYTANSLIQTNGVYVSGNLYSTQVFGDYTAANGVYVLTDGTGSAPAWYIDFEFIDVVKFNRVVMNINYTQSSGHTIYVQLYNTVTSAWDNIGTYTGLGSYYAFALEVIDEAAYVSGLSKVQLRLYHSNAGNASHQTSIDYVALEQSYQGPQGPRGPTGATGATGATGNGVSSGGTAGQVLIKNSSTNYDTGWSNNLIDSYNTGNSAYLQANAAYLSQNTTGVYANSSFVQANLAFGSANSASSYANSAYLQANTAISDALAYSIALG